MGLNIGAFAGGLSRGVESGARLQLEQARAAREKGRDDREKEKAEREKAAWQGLSDLVKEYTNPQTKPPTLSNAPPATGEPAAALNKFDPAMGGAPIPPTTETGSAAGLPSRDGMRAAPKTAETETAQAGENLDRASMPMSGVGIPARASSAPAAQTPSVDADVDQLADKHKLTPDETQQLRGEVAKRVSMEKIGFGLWRNPNLFKDPQFATRAAQLFLKAGMSEGVKWLERGAQAVEENGIDGLRRLMSGDARGAEQVFNQSGRLRVVPGSTREVGNGKWEITLEGGEKQTIDPRQMLRSFLKPSEFFNVELKEREIDFKADDRRSAVAHRERVVGETERHNKEVEKNQSRNADLRLEIARIRSERGADAATALERNINFLIKNKIANDPSDAFGKLRTAMEKPEEDAILSMAGTLMRGPGYAGKDGWNRALKTATDMVREAKGANVTGGGPGGTGTPGAPQPGKGRSYTVRGKSFTDADIDATAKKYGITPDEVKQRLGIR